MSTSSVSSAEPVQAPTLSRNSLRSPRWLRRLTALSWAGWALAVLSLWLQYQLGVYHTLDWLWLPFAVVGVIAGIAAFLLGVWRTLFGPIRRIMFGWALVGIVPPLLWVVLVMYMFSEQGRRNLPNTHAHKIGRMAAISLIDWHGWWRYRHCLETDRLVMYYDDGVTEPAADAAAMDAHLAQLEKILGRRQHSRIRWVRGSALGILGTLGFQGMSIHSMALGSDASPALWLDRHELAHSFLYQFSRPDAEPPMLLLEGWAMAVDGHPAPLAPSALAGRSRVAASSGKDFDSSKGPDSCLRVILSPDSYHVGHGHAYAVGGAFVEYVIRQHGPEKFVELYNSIHPETYEAEFNRILGCPFDALEREFWNDAETNGKRGK
jgi:hypothetical protein